MTITVGDLLGTIVLVWMIILFYASALVAIVGALLVLADDDKYLLWGIPRRIRYFIICCGYTAFSVVMGTLGLAFLLNVL